MFVRKSAIISISIFFDYLTNDVNVFTTTQQIQLTHT